MATSKSPTQQEDTHYSSDADPVGDKLQALPCLMRGGEVHHIVMLAIFSIILYYVCEACIYVDQDIV